MPNALDVLLGKIGDPILRNNIRSQVERLEAKRSFGLVFESHIPERVRLPEHPVRVGVRVVYKDSPNSPTFEVLALKGKLVTLYKVRNPDGTSLSAAQKNEVQNETAHLPDLVVIADFGEPVFPVCGDLVRSSAAVTSRRT
jgi:adenine-specific DNA-methyltransferase